MKLINCEQRLKTSASTIEEMSINGRLATGFHLYHYRQMQAEEEAATQKWPRNHLHCAHTIKKLQSRGQNKKKIDILEVISYRCHMLHGTRFLQEPVTGEENTSRFIWHLYSTVVIIMGNCFFWQGRLRDSFNSRQCLCLKQKIALFIKGFSLITSSMWVIKYIS